MKKIAKVFVKILCVLLVVLIIPNYYSVIYKLEKGSKFNGASFYNPYHNLDGKWIKANFHAHAKAFAGLANGENTATEMLHKYDSLNYDLACISNYNFIEDSVEGYHFLSAYEHGVNIKWIHQLVMNDKKSKWFDYPLLQLRSNKQFTINRLKNENNLVVLNHPGHKSAYTKKDLMYLNNYDLIEGISTFANSIEEWDYALSNGHPAWIVGNDDSHDLSDYHVGVCWNMVHVDTFTNNAILESLKKGKTYATKGWLGQEMNKIKSVQVKDGHYILKLMHKADSITLFSDWGKKVAFAVKSDSITYKIQQDNSYVRAEVFETETWNTYTKMYLNPVVRTTSGELSAKPVNNNINYFLSVLYWIGLLIIHILCIRLIFKFK